MNTGALLLAVALVAFFGILLVNGLPQIRTENGSFGDGSSGEEASGTGASSPDKASCEAAGGRWEQVPLVPSPGAFFCNLPVQDAGTGCVADEDCEGRCLVPLTHDDEVQLATPPRSPEKEQMILSKYPTGVCDSWKTSTGCPYTFQGGKIVHGPCP